MSALPASVQEQSLAWIASRQAAMLQETIALAEINSGSLNVAGVQAVRERLAALFADLGGTAEVLPVAPWEQLSESGEIVRRPLGEALRIRKHPEAPLQVFLCGHMDTVFGL
ncbi:MAG: hypothetical protein ACPHCJ_07770, partial [Oceanococcaceae bacterium]